MAELPRSEQQIVQAVTAQYQRDLIEALPELRVAVRTSEAQGSFSCTLDLKHSKRGRFLGKFRPRVRRPREATDFDFHLSDDGQLALGLPAGWDDRGDGDDGGDDLE